VSQGEGWPTKYPWNLLPPGGSHPFVPPKGRNWWKNPKRGPNGGYLDADDNEWLQHYGPAGLDHWDVQHPGGGHTNVRPDGEIHHGPDNFP
jgi:hypothetical protein